MAAGCTVEAGQEGRAATVVRGAPPGSRKRKQRKVGNASFPGLLVPSIAAAGSEPDCTYADRALLSGEVVHYTGAKLAGCGGQLYAQVLLQVCARGGEGGTEGKGDGGSPPARLPACLAPPHPHPELRCPLAPTPPPVACLQTFTPFNGVAYWPYWVRDADLVFCPATRACGTRAELGAYCSDAPNGGCCDLRALGGAARAKCVARGDASACAVG